MNFCSYPGCDHPAWDTKTTHYNTCFMHTAPSVDVIRCVWQTICANPHASIDELHDATGYSRSVCNRARQSLIDRGAVSALWFEGD